MGVGRAGRRGAGVGPACAWWFTCCWARACRSWVPGVGAADAGLSWLGAGLGGRAGRPRRVGRSVRSVTAARPARSAGVPVAGCWSRGRRPVLSVPDTPAPDPLQQQGGTTAGGTAGTPAGLVACGPAVWTPCSARRPRRDDLRCRAGAQPGRELIVLAPARSGSGRQVAGAGRSPDPRQDRDGAPGCPCCAAAATARDPLGGVPVRVIDAQIRSPRDGRRQALPAGHQPADDTRPRPAAWPRSTERWDRDVLLRANPPPRRPGLRARPPPDSPGIYALLVAYQVLRPPSRTAARPGPDPDRLSLTSPGSRPRPGPRAGSHRRPADLAHHRRTLARGGKGKGK